jgi:hypothetical protein
VPAGSDGRPTQWNPTASCFLFHPPPLLFSDRRGTWRVSLNRRRRRHCQIILPLQISRKLYGGTNDMFWKSPCLERARRDGRAGSSAMDFFLSMEVRQSQKRCCTASEHQSIRSEGDIPKNYSQRGSPRQHHRKGLATLRIFLNQPEDIIRCFSACLTLHPGIVPGHPWAA